MFDTKTLKPGDTIGVRRQSYGDDNIDITTVAKVTPSGIVHLEGDHGLKPFNKHGERKIGGSDWRRAYLITVEEANAAIEAKKARRAAQALHSQLCSAVERVVPSRATDVFTNPEASAKIVAELRALADAVEARDHDAIRRVAHRDHQWEKSEKGEECRICGEVRPAV